MATWETPQTSTDSALYDVIASGTGTTVAEITDTETFIHDLDRCSDSTPAYTYCG
ncbi:hypothetical protein ACGFIK_21150 [Micromonospora sp. NPDC048871]|uniref:hypothetical protein n=1 Tax=unclassified Micromonospora TaxID=2617518 RepID=UPI002E0F10F0|nr:hypothetical protein OIE53_19125 [Micromonospora sp. NBC_01739]